MKTEALNAAEPENSDKSKPDESPGRKAQEAKAAKKARRHASPAATSFSL